MNENRRSVGSITVGRWSDGRPFATLGVDTIEPTRSLPVVGVSEFVGTLSLDIARRYGGPTLTLLDIVRPFDGGTDAGDSPTVTPATSVSKNSRSSLETGVSRDPNATLGGGDGPRLRSSNPLSNGSTTDSSETVRSRSRPGTPTRPRTEREASRPGSPALPWRDTEPTQRRRGAARLPLFETTARTQRTAERGRGRRVGGDSPLLIPSFAPHTGSSPTRHGRTRHPSRYSRNRPFWGPNVVDGAGAAMDQSRSLDPLERHGAVSPLSLLFDTATSRSTESDPVESLPPGLIRDHLSRIGRVVTDKHRAGKRRSTAETTVTAVFRPDPEGPESTPQIVEVVRNGAVSSPARVSTDGHSLERPDAWRTHLSRLVGQSRSDLTAASGSPGSVTVLQVDRGQADTASTSGAASADTTAFDAVQRGDDGSTPPGTDADSPRPSMTYRASDSSESSPSPDHQQGTTTHRSTAASGGPARPSRRTGDEQRPGAPAGRGSPSERPDFGQSADAPFGDGRAFEPTRTVGEAPDRGGTAGQRANRADGVDGTPALADAEQALDTDLDSLVDVLYRKFERKRRTERRRRGL